MENPTLKEQTLTFEEAMTRLEEVIRLLEGGEIPLDQALGLFEQGIVLARLCNDRLNEAEGKIQLLLKGEDGALNLQPVTIGEEGIQRP